MGQGPVGKPAKPADPRERVELGRIGGAFGVRGWVKVVSYTRPREGILGYRDWLVGRDGMWTSRTVLEGRPHGSGLVARLDGCADRDTAEALAGAVIAVQTRELQPTEAGEFYWRDLIGLEVVNGAGVSFGHVVELMETGANDVLVVRGDRERLVPFTRGAVREVDVATGTITVDWEEDF